MYRTAALVFLGCFFCYILFTRKPDYFEAEFTPGKVIAGDKPNLKLLQYPVGKELFNLPFDGWIADRYNSGENVEVIYDPSTPENGAVYSFFTYWLKLPELFASAAVFIALFASAVFITGKNRTEDEGSLPTAKKRKYID
jgi:hypothetical protein